MALNLKAFVRFTGRLLSRASDTSFSWTPRRVVIFLALYALYPPFEILTWLSFLLDELFFPGYRRIQVAAPVFIVGILRGGTTFLHRLLAGDRARFTTITMWETLFAPSIVQRRLVGVLAWLDRWLGGPCARQVADLEQRWHKANVMHRTALREPEEDDYLLLHIWSALTIGLSSGVLGEAAPYAYFDTLLPLAERQRAVAFYHRCLQRHLCAHGHTHKQYLAKNPALTPKLDSLYEWFPDARVICLVRNPLEAVPSFLDMMQLSWRVLGDPVESEDLRQFIVDLAGHWYRYPLDRLARAPHDRQLLVRYDDLLAEPAETVARIYDRFGFRLSAAFPQTQRQEAEKARRFRSRHRYSLQQIGLTRQQILAEYADVFDRFGFDTRVPRERTDRPAVERYPPAQKPRPLPTPARSGQRRPEVSTKASA